jgi:hypothetical protein
MTTYDSDVRSQPKRRIELITAAVGLVTAVVSLTLAFISNQAKENAQEQTATVQVESDQAQERIQQLEGELADAKQQIAQLKTSTTAPTTSSASSVLHEGTATVAPGRTVDLDALPADPQWGMLGSYYFDVRWGCNASAICFLGSSLGVIVDESADAADCRTTTGYSNGTIPLSRLKIGLTFCVRTGGNRFSLVKVTKFTTDSAPLTLFIRTLKNEED